MSGVVLLQADVDESAAVRHVLDWVEYAAVAIEVLAVIVIVATILYATASYAIGRFWKAPEGSAYNVYRARLGSGLLLGLEILVAADVIRTVAFEPTIESAVILGLLVLIRTFLSWSLVVEIEERWPWQAPRPENVDTPGKQLELRAKSGRDDSPAL
ncbi:MAG: DUF1622 domain-containing protein [Thermomicrobiales bacterium]